MGKHRSRLRILANILSVVSSNDGAKKTQIMYQAYLSYRLLVQYLNDVTKAGLLTCGAKNHYEITPKGKKFLAQYSEYHKSLTTVDKQLTMVENQRIFLEKMCPSNEITDDKNKTLQEVV